MLTVDTELDDLLHRLARVEPTTTPVISLYLNAQADERGRDRFARFLQDELRDRVRGFRGNSGIKASLERDVARIDAYLTSELRSHTNGVAIFSRAETGLFEALQIDAPFPRHQLHLADVPHLYPLALVSDQFPRYAALIADTNTARILVFALNRRVDTTVVENEKTRRTSGSGWSQARFQRHVDEHRLQHAKEVVARLDEIVRADDISQIVVGGDDVIVPLLRAQFPPHLASLVIDTLPIDITTPDHEVLGRTLQAVRQNDARSDQTIAQQAFDAHAAGGLGVVGVKDVRRALELGQVHVLLLTAAALPDGIVAGPAAPKKQHSGTNGGANGGANAAGLTDDRIMREEVSNELIALARQTDAEIRFIEDPALLRDAGGAAALLRFRLNLPATKTAGSSAS